MALGSVDLLLSISLLLCSNLEEESNLSVVTATITKPGIETYAPSNMELNLGMYLGGLFLSDAHELYRSTNSFHSPIDSPAPMFGLRMGFFPRKFIGLEVEGGYAYQENNRSEDNHLFAARSHLVVQYPARLTPFLVGGGGVLGVDAPAGGDVDAALHWGTGVKFHIKPAVKVRLDLRHLISAAVGPNAGNTSHLEVTLGMSFALVREKPKPVIISYKTPVVESEPEIELEPVVESPASTEVAVPLFFAQLDSIHFSFDSDQVRISAHSILEQAVKLAKEQADLFVTVVGHADATGPEIYNQYLSERRAQSVANYLIEQGVARNQIEIRGEGEHQPVSDNRSKEGRASNRRTEVSIVQRPLDSKNMID